MVSDKGTSQNDVRRTDLKCSRLLGRRTLFLACLLALAIEIADEHRLVGTARANAAGESATPDDASKTAARLKWRKRQKGPATTVKYAMSGTLIVSGGSDNQIHVWNATSGDQVCVISPGQTFATSSVDRFVSGLPMGLVSDGPTLVTVERNRMLTWDIRTGKQEREIHANKTDCCRLAVAPDGKMAAIADWHSDQVRVIALDTDSISWTIRASPEPSGPILLSAIAFSPDSRILACARVMGLQLWDTGSGKEKRGLLDPHQSVQGHNLLCAVGVMCFSPDSKYLACATETQDLRRGTWDQDHFLGLWAVRSGRCIRTLANEGVASLAFSPNGRYLASALVIEGIGLWDLTTFQKQVVPVQGVRDACFAPSGKEIACVTQEGTIEVWDISRCLH